MTTSSKQSAMFCTGLAVLIVGLLATVGLWYAADQRQSNAVSNLARAPSGCETTLDFAAVGDFTMYAETAGRFDEPIAGNCAADGAYNVPGDSLPAISLKMTSPAGDEIVLTDASGSTYDVDGFQGESIRTFSVETPGDHILRVDVSGDSEVRLVMAVGKEPSDGVGMMRLGAVLAALAGLVLGGTMTIASRRPPKTAATVPFEPWATGMPAMPEAPMDPESWEPALGPPSHTPGAPPAAPSTPEPTGWTLQPVSPPMPTTEPSDDARPSPWAPPNGPAQ
ncbi:hypothetical protein [uncultured Ilumatobacter sp.]|uniref:hypothetical protein n=1 Tax=uncultured Ilumatobacter sp. TaxID=879968 RepID=UPI00374F3148